MDLVGALAVEINGGATCDPVKPGGEAAARRIEGTRRTPYLQEDILDQLLRRGAVIEDLQAHTEDRVAVTIVELGEGYLDFRSIELSHKLLVRWFISPQRHHGVRTSSSSIAHKKITHRNVHNVFPPPARLSGLVVRSLCPGEMSRPIAPSTRTLLSQ